MPTTNSRTPLGDKITAALEALGARRVVDYIGVDCGCEKHRLKLNEFDERIRGTTKLIVTKFIRIR